MAAIELFRQEHDLVHQMVDGFAFAGMDAAQLHHLPSPGIRALTSVCRAVGPGSGRSQPLACGLVPTMC
jgi:hypothetical protein